MKKKVLFLIESLGGGGAEKVLYTLLRNIDREKFDITLCSVNDLGVYRGKLRKIVKYKPLIKRQNGKGFFNRLRYLINFKLVYSWLPLRWVYNFYVPKGNDVEVSFIEGFSTKLLSHSSNKRAKRIAWVHTDLKSNHWIRDIYRNFSAEKKSYEKFDQIIGVSNVVSDAVKSLYSVENVRTLYNPIYSGEILRLSEEDVDENLVKSDRVRICSVGRFVEQKRFDRLLRVVSGLKEGGIEVELWLLGNGPLHSEYETYIQEHGLSDRVRLCGFKTNPYPYMKACDLFVCSSAAEGFSMAMTEACILGLPMITTDCSGMGELLEGGKYGIITRNDFDSLYKAVKEVVTNPALLEDLRHKSVERFDFFSLKNRLSAIETELLA